MKLGCQLGSAGLSQETRTERSLHSVIPLPGPAMSQVMFWVLKTAASVEDLVLTILSAQGGEGENKYSCGCPGDQGQEGEVPRVSCERARSLEKQRA